jgi:hypothetical protein
MNYPAASSGVSKTLNSVIPHLMRNPGFPVKTGTQSLGWFPTFVGTTSGFRLEFIPYLIRGRNDELAASGGEYNPKGIQNNLALRNLLSTFSRKMDFFKYTIILF